MNVDTGQGPGAPALVAQFERLAEAPGGVARLRELVLALAVRGKLVPQRDGDEPAGRFLASASETRCQMVAEGRLRRTAVVTPVEMSEHAYPLPSGWSWARIGDLGQVVGGGTPKSDIPELWAESGVPWLTPADLYGRREMRISRGRRDISPRGLSESSAQLLPPGTVLFSSRAPIGYVAIADAPLATNQGFKSCVPFVEGVSEYLYWHLKQLAPAIDEAASGTTFKEISGSDFAAVVIALPPLAEQARIVARVDELMQLCDALEAKGRLEAQQHARLLETLLGTLTDSTTPVELAANWQRVAEYFDLLLDRPAAVDALEQTVLQLAVRGLLVSQHQDDEPASVLLRRIHEEKESLAAAGKIKRDKASPTLAMDEVPFGLPDSWVWSRLGTVAKKITDGTHHSPANFASGDFKYLSAKNIKSWGIDLTDVTYVPTSVHQEIYARCDPEHGDILYIKDGATTGVLTINTLKEQFSLLSSVGVVKPSCGVTSDYLALLMRSPFFYQAMRDGMTGVAITRVTLSKLGAALVPLPPLTEQARIVARVTELRRLCADLRQRLAASQATQSRLAEALVESVASA